MFLNNSRKTIFIYFTLTLVTVISSIILYLPFILHSDNWLGLKISNPKLDYIYKNFDGPFYIIPAKTLYKKDLIDIPGKGLIISLPLSDKYFAAHLPLYPILIRLFSFIGYLKSMVFVNLLSTVLFALFFYYFIKKLNLSEKPFILTIIMLFLPRFLVVRSVGAPEGLFLLLIFISIYFFEKKSYLYSGIAGALATMTKIPGILLFAGYMLVFFEKWLKTKKIDFKWLSILLIPLGLLAVFLLYYFQYGDFLAFFHTGGVVAMPYPFSVFNSSSKWVITGWLEEIVVYFFIYLLAILNLKDTKYRSLFYFPLVFFFALTFVQHRDISRYALPIWPFACIAFGKLFTSKKFITALIIILPAIYLYAWNFLLTNIVPISDWSPFL